MFSYPSKIDTRIAQAVAIVTFVTTYTILIKPEWSWLIYPLTADFILRYIHPKLSPIARIFATLASVLKLEKQFYFAPPKRFAVLIGIIFTLGISLTTLLGFILIQQILLYGILFASFLQGFLDFCVGCELYNFLLQVGIISDYQVYST